MSEVLLSPDDRMELWRRLTTFEKLYGFPSAARHKAFLGFDGRLVHDEDYEEWSEAFVAWQITTRSSYIPECIDTGELEVLAAMQRADAMVHPAVA